MRMSMSGLSRWNCSSRGISHIEAKEAKVVSATDRRPAVWRIWRTALSMRGSGLRHGRQQLRAGAGQLHRARVAQEQAHAHFFFQRLDLAAHGRLGERHLFRGGAEVQVPRHGFEGAQVAGRDRAGAQVRLGVLHGAGSCQ